MPKKTARKIIKRARNKKISKISFELKHAFIIVICGFILVVLLLKLSYKKQNVSLPALDLTDKVEVYTGHPKYGLAGYTSGSVRNGESVVNLEIIPRNLSKIETKNFPCEKGNRLEGYTADFELHAKYDINTSPVDKMDLGKQNVFGKTEQDGLFASVEPISDNPVVEAMVLSERESCFDSKVSVYGWDGVNSKIVVYSFKKRDGTAKPFIYVPKGVKIPQRDLNLKMVEDKYDPVSQKRVKTRYEFNFQNNSFEETESWLQ